MINKKVTIAALLAIGLLFAGTAFLLSAKEKSAPPVIHQANVLKKVISVEGMTCESCEATIERAGEKIEGIVSIEASASDKRAIVEFDTTQTSVEQIMQAITATGYKTLGSEDFTEKSENNVSLSRCGAGKCGAGKCGGAE
ncbi:MAG: heavy-metal-associated domain-containing protein [Campylobacterales bacterium]|nr:heavy-metal-associated domain-containing protein [Campylobacterales bacterium]